MNETKTSLLICRYSESFSKYTINPAFSSVVIKEAIVTSNQSRPQDPLCFQMAGQAKKPLDEPAKKTTGIVEYIVT